MFCQNSFKFKLIKPVFKMCQFCSMLLCCLQKRDESSNRLMPPNQNTPSNKVKALSSTKPVSEKAITSNLDSKESVNRICPDRNDNLIRVDDSTNNIDDIVCIKINTEDCFEEPLKDELQSSTQMLQDALDTDFIHEYKSLEYRFRTKSKGDL